MRRYDGLYPAYGFAVHFGYATKAHLAAIEAHGPCPLHRMSFRPFKSAQGLHPHSRIPLLSG
jgi:ribonuclease HII